MENGVFDVVHTKELRVSKIYSPQNGPDVTLNVNASTITLGGQSSFFRSGSGNPQLINFNFDNCTASSGIQTDGLFTFVLSQSGTAGYRGVSIAVTETSTGSGEKSLIYGSVGGTQKFRVDNAGLIETASPVLIKSTVALTNGAGASAGTLANAPAVGNPTKWIPINDNGTTRYIPAW